MTVKHEAIPAYLQGGRDAIKRIAPNLNGDQVAPSKSVAALVDSAETKIKEAKRLLAS